MMDFQTAHCYDTAFWTKTPDPPTPRKLQKLTDDPFPVEDPLGLVPLLTQDEQSLLTPNHRFHAQWIDIESPTDMENFREIYQRVTDRWYTILGEETFLLNGKNMKLLRYLESYYTIPPWLTTQLLSR